MKSERGVQSESRVQSKFRVRFILWDGLGDFNELFGPHRLLHLEMFAEFFSSQPSPRVDSTKDFNPGYEKKKRKSERTM